MRPPSRATRGSRRMFALGDSCTAPAGAEGPEVSGCLRSSGTCSHLVAAGLGSSSSTRSCSGATNAGAGRGAGDRRRGHPTAVRGPHARDLAGHPRHRRQRPRALPDPDRHLRPARLRRPRRLAVPRLHAARRAAAGPARGQDRQDRRPGRPPSLQGIRDRAPGAEVVLVGYPAGRPGQWHLRDPAARRGRLRLRPLRSPSELNAALRGAARKGKATYIDLLEPSEGHDICAGPDAWVNGFETDVARALAFHPFAQEQQAIADLILAKVEKARGKRARPGRRRWSARPASGAARRRWPRRSRPRPAGRRRAAPGRRVSRSRRSAGRPPTRPGPRRG